jgi:L-2-hydroxyglutarate oxidase LhgO
VLATDYLIVGGGIIGLSIAKALKERNMGVSVRLIEKEPHVGAHSSGRNSGVLHAGFYYSADSLKAKFTRDGNAQMHAFCKEKSLKINRCGKVIVAQNESQIAGLEELKRRGDANGVELEWMSEDELALKFPEAKTTQKALFSPNTSSVDPKAVVEALALHVKELGVEIITDCAYEAKAGKDAVLTSKGIYFFDTLINAAGLYADKIGRDYGASKNYTIIPFKGIYLKDSQNKMGLTTNIYPVPNLANPFLGVHYTLTADGAAKIGPTAIPAFWRENYKGFSGFCLQELGQIAWYEAKLFATNAFGFRSLAYDEVRKYQKSYFLGLATALTRGCDHGGFREWSKPGIRAQLLNTNTLELVQDFVVERKENSVHVLNAVSPAFTCAFPFAKWVVETYI